MLGQVRSATLDGVEGVMVRVEAQVGTGLPGFFIVGLPRGAVREGRDRIQSSLRAVGVPLDGLKITVNLAPADLVKEGAGLDLAMAVALLVGAEEGGGEATEGAAFLGELGLDGRLHPVRGILPLVLACVRAGVERLFLPRANLGDAEAVARGMRLVPADSLADVLRILRGVDEVGSGNPPPREDPERGPSPGDGQGPGEHGPGERGPGERGPGERGPGERGSGERGSGGGGSVDLAWIRGHALPRRALEIAAAGGHSLLLEGPPGSGKSMLARALPTLLPDLEEEEALSVSVIHSAAGLLRPGSGMVCRPPFRAPHHGASRAALVGGGAPLRPGEVTLAHRGVLFLDELPHWSRQALEALREPVEAGIVDVIRANRRATFPARFLLVAAMNPCPCGRWGEPDDRCTCDPALARRYRSRVSGPLLDRFDLHVQVRSIPPAELLAPGRSEPSARVRRRVEEARFILRSESPGPDGRRKASREALAFLAHAGAGSALTGRGVTGSLRVAATIAALAGRVEVGPDDIAEALLYRPL